jgi:AcrR family transcriptional regulator
MGRPAGVHNEDYDEKRAALLDRVTARLVAVGADRASFREMAATAGVSVPTLRHYFGDRQGLIRAWMAWRGGQGAPYLAELATTTEPFDLSIRTMLEFVALGLERGRVVELHVVGLMEGLTNPALGPSYLTSILEPTLQAAEQRLALHAERGEMRAVDLRAAALALLSPLILAVLHQRDLGGRSVRCLDISAFIATHAEAFVRAYRA